MDADEFILTLCELMELEYETPLHQKLGMSQTLCHQWIRNLYAKRLTLRDAQQTVRNIVAQKGQQTDPEDVDELLYYI